MCPKPNGSQDFGCCALPAPALLPKTLLLPSLKTCRWDRFSETFPSLPDRGGLTAHRPPKLLIRIFLRRRPGRHDILSAERFLR